MAVADGGVLGPWVRCNRLESLRFPVSSKLARERETPSPREPYRQTPGRSRLRSCAVRSQPQGRDALGVPHTFSEPIYPALGSSLSGGLQFMPPCFIPR